MAAFNYDFTEEILCEMRENSPLNGFMGGQQKASSSRYSVPAPQLSKEQWFRATIAGFVSHLSVNGWTCSRRTMSGGIVFTWRSPRGQMLETKILGQDRERQLAHACGLLAGWEPDLMYWQAAFKEVDVPTSGRS